LRSNGGRRESAEPDLRPNTKDSGDRQRSGPDVQIRAVSTILPENRYTLFGVMLGLRLPRSNVFAPLLLRAFFQGGLAQAHLWRRRLQQCDQLLAVGAQLLAIEIA
jgi:hypothetical protein